MGRVENKQRGRRWRRTQWTRTSEGVSRLRAGCRLSRRAKRQCAAHCSTVRSGRRPAQRTRGERCTESTRERQNEFGAFFFRSLIPSVFDACDAAPALFGVTEQQKKDGVSPGSSHAGAAWKSKEGEGARGAEAAFDLRAKKLAAVRTDCEQAELRRLELVEGLLLLLLLRGLRHAAGGCESSQGDGGRARETEAGRGLKGN